jgi:hypothetical protein
LSRTIVLKMNVRVRERFERHRHRLGRPPPLVPVAQ